MYPSVKCYIAIWTHKRNGYHPTSHDSVSFYKISHVEKIRFFQPPPPNWKRPHNETNFSETEMQMPCFIARQFMCFHLFCASHPPSAKRLPNRLLQEGPQSFTEVYICSTVQFWNTKIICLKAHAHRLACDCTTLKMVCLMLKCERQH
jgi:hypothetical protein